MTDFSKNAQNALIQRKKTYLQLLKDNPDNHEIRAELVLFLCVQNEFKEALEHGATLFYCNPKHKEYTGLYTSTLDSAAEEGHRGMIARHKRVFEGSDIACETLETPFQNLIKASDHHPSYEL